MRANLLCLCLMTFSYASGQFLPVPQVSGAPFSADEIQLENPSPNVQNVLPMKTIAVYRDSAGRTRVDVSVPWDPTGNPNLVIDDPVANVIYMIDERNKFVRRLAFPSPRPVPSASEPPKNSPAPVMMFPRFQNVQTATKSLGNQLIQGISTEGRRVTSISPQTSPGCEKSTIESWYSQELWLTLLQKHSNCMGEGSTHLENIRRAEPDPGLFRIPQDYVVVEQEWNKPPAKPPLVSK
jgi:hypothetical protein